MNETASEFEWLDWFYTRVNRLQSLRAFYVNTHLKPDVISVLKEEFETETGKGVPTDYE